MAKCICEDCIRALIQEFEDNKTIITCLLDKRCTKNDYIEIKQIIINCSKYLPENK